MALFQALSAQADLTYRVAHVPTTAEGAAASAAAGAQQGSLVPVRLAPLSVWVNTMVPLGDAREELLRDLQVGTDAMGKVNVYRDIEVRALSVMHGDAYSVPFVFGASDVALLGDFVQPELADFCSVAHAAPATEALWALSGKEFASWVPYVSKLVAPALYVERDPPHFVEEITDVALRRALQGFKNELMGAIQHGWIINADGSTVKAIAPSEKEAEYAEVQANALATIGIPSSSIALRPPSEVELESLRKSAGARAAAHVRRVFAKLPRVDVAPALAQLNDSADDIYMPLKERNDANIEQYITSGVQRTGDAYTKKIYDLYVKIPMTAATIDDRLTDCKMKAAADLKVLLGRLETSPHAAAGYEKVVRDLEGSATDQHLRNDKKVASILAAAVDDVNRHVEGQAPQLDLPMGPTLLHAKLSDMRVKATERFVQILEGKFGEPVREERARDVDTARQQLMKELEFFMERVTLDNEVKIGELARSYAAQMSTAFHQQVIQGNALPYPSNENTIFDLAATQATGLVLQFNKSLAHFIECPVFVTELEKLEQKLQDQICGTGQSAMARNTEEHAKLKWVLQASNAVENKIKETAKEEENAAKLLQDLMEKYGGSAYHELSRSMVKRITSYWCSTVLGNDCPGNCYKWDTNVFIHSLDINGFCEPSWCNMRVLGGGTASGETGSQWRQDSAFRRCPDHEYEPCKTFWDQRGLTFVKYLLRTFWGAGVVAFVASWLLKARQ
eukprot:TRINITY_DN5232_c0_g1_i2.p1 TRINITY_DN5232_c0_g1~~TRINITY_DN5232_c0_g1_i2.p1  ORF type:complete len:736 (+),score=186.19 TRINITY_DN5232_c0_g1_i2:645-2852(+)